MSAHHSDALIIGGGHNGLVCACYLARAGLKVTCWSAAPSSAGRRSPRNSIPGSATRWPAYTVSLLNPKVIRDLELAGHGLRVVERRSSNFLPTADGRYLRIGAGRTARRGGANSRTRDAERLGAYGERLERIADVLRDLVLRDAAQCGRRRLARGAAASCCRAARVGRRLGRLDMTMRRELLRLFATVGRRLPGRLVRERSDQGGVRLRRHRRQLRQPLHARARPMCCCTMCSAR